MSFWTDAPERHRRIARQYYEGIEYDWRPYDYVTSRRMCSCLDYTNRCSFPLNGKVERIRYEGPSVQSLG